MPTPNTAARTGGLALLAAGVAALLYLPALQYGWVWNDTALAVSHATKNAAGGSFHPAVNALYRGEWLAGIGTPAFYHLTSLILHAVATWLFFLLIRGVGATPGVALGASLLFAAHPIHVEAVAYVSGRPDLLATATALGALVVARSRTVCGPGGGRSWRVYAAYALLAIAVLSDDVALVTPLLLISLDRWGSPRVPVRGRVTVYVGFAAVALAGILARIGAGALHMNEPHDLLAPGAGPWAAVIAAGEFLHTLTVPHPLNAMRSLSEAQAASWTLRVGAILSIAALALYVWLRRRDPLARTGAVLLVLPVIPSLPLPFFQGPYVAEGAAYFASVGFCFLAGSLYDWLGGRSPATRKLVPVFAVLIAAVAGVGTLKRLPIWKSNTALLTEAVKLNPNDSAPHLALAEQYLAAGDDAGALSEIDRAIALDPADTVPYHRKTVLLSRLGRYLEAEAAARRTIALDPKDAVSWANLGDLLTRQGKARDAVAACRQAVLLGPRNAENWYNFGVALAATDSLPQAVLAYGHAIAINPQHFQALNNLGAVLGNMGRIAEARDTYQKAVDVMPSSVEARMNLALALLRLGDTPGASRERDAIQKYDPVAAQQLVEMIKQFEQQKGAPR